MTAVIPSSQLILVTGPSRSGKSEWAETLASQSKQQVIYIATSKTDPTDLEWQNRILIHKNRRPVEWITQEIPENLTTTLPILSRPDTCILVDSLGTWLANCLEQNESTWEMTQNHFLEILTQLPGTIILVAEETGWGVVPAYPLGRTFRDRLGMLVRKIGAISTCVYLVTGGYVLNLTELGSPLQSI